MYMKNASELERFLIDGMKLNGIQHVRCSREGDSAVSFQIAIKHTTIHVIVRFLGARDMLHVAVPSFAIASAEKKAQERVLRLLVSLNAKTAVGSFDMDLDENRPGISFGIMYPYDGDTGVSARMAERLISTVVGTVNEHFATIMGCLLEETPDQDDDDDQKPLSRMMRLLGLKGEADIVVEPIVKPGAGGTADDGDGTGVEDGVDGVEGADGANDVDGANDGDGTDGEFDGADDAADSVADDAVDDQIDAGIDDAADDSSSEADR